MFLRNKNWKIMHFWQDISLSMKLVIIFLLINPIMPFISMYLVGHYHNKHFWFISFAFSFFFCLYILFLCIADLRKINADLRKMK